MSYLDLTGLNTLWAKIKNWVSGQGYITDAPSDNKQYARKNGVWSEFVSGGGTWGSITGTLSNQTDLQSALNGKEKTIYKQAAEPSGAVDGDIWIDTDDSGESHGGSYYGVCVTIPSTVEKVVTCEDFVLSEGVAIDVYFSYSNTASDPTLNVNNTGAYKIDRNHFQKSWEEDSVIHFVFVTDSYGVSYWKMAYPPYASERIEGVVKLQDVTQGWASYTAATSQSVYTALSNKADSSHTHTKLGLISGYYGNNNSGASNSVKYVDCDGFVLESGAIITMRCKYGNIHSGIQINVNLTGAKDVYNDDGTDLHYDAGELITLVYDGTAYYAVGRGAIQSINDTIGNVEALLAAL